MTTHNPTQQTFHIGKMTCGGCALEVENSVKNLAGVDSVEVNFATEKMILQGDIDFDSLRERVESVGKTIAKEAVQHQPSRGGILGFWDYLVASSETRFALIGGGLILLTILVSILLTLPETITGISYTIAMLIALYPIAKSGINSLRVNRTFNINLLMSIAAIGAILIGEYLEGATVIFLFAVGEALEGYTADRARDSLRSLLALKPQEAIRLDNQTQILVPIEALHVGDVILVKSGERIPMDGVVINGESGVNQATITGESLPVFKQAEDTVYAGTLNGDGVLEIEVTHLAEDNTLSRIIQLVEEAQSVRAPSQRLIDKFAHYYTPAVVVLASAVALIPPLLFNAPFYDTPDGHGWFYRALSMLVIACPCALVISTPVTVISAITASARRGVLIKGGAYLEALGQLKAIAFDKTGTLTQGKPIVTDFRAVDCSVGQMACDDCEDVLSLAASLEHHSTHPLANAVMEAVKQRELQPAVAENVSIMSGQGIQGDVGGSHLTLGSHRLFDQDYPHSSEFCQLVSEVEAQGQTTMMLSDGERVRGYIAVADTPRETSKSVVAELNTLGLETVMLTGDNESVAMSVGAELGVTDIRANLMPADKVSAIQSLQSSVGNVGMVGDGVNDAPALATAEVGIAMGGAGSAQAMETADVVLMQDDLTQLPQAIRLARFARRLIQQNVALSFGMKGIFLLLALFGGVSLWMAVFADVGMSLVVTLNGMRPLRTK